MSDRTAVIEECIDVLLAEISSVKEADNLRFVAGLKCAIEVLSRLPESRPTPGSETCNSTQHVYVVPTGGYVGRCICGQSLHQGHEKWRTAHPDKWTKMIEESGMPAESLRVLSESYGFIVNHEGTLCGLTMGDMGYEDTEFRLQGHEQLYRIEETSVEQLIDEEEAAAAPASVGAGTPPQDDEPRFNRDAMEAAERLRAAAPVPPRGAEPQGEDK